MGLHTLADLRRLPRDGLARRFGTELLADIDRARGHAAEAHAWLTLAPRFASRLELMCRADTSAQLLVGARVLLARLVAWAGARQARIARFTLVMHHEPRRQRAGTEAPPDRTSLVIAPAEPAADADHLYSLLAERLGRLPLAAPALELSLQCEHLVAGTPPNGELFASPASQREGLARLVERLQARLGIEQVQRCVPVADHRPECSTRWLPADPARLGAATPGVDDALASAGVLGPQPLWLLPQPQALAERTQQPLLDGQPLQLLAGPERLETGWWDAQGPAVRDYFIAQAASGALVWVYRHRLPADDGGPGWFLQGLFA
jgi:protein ImuB